MNFNKLSAEQQLFCNTALSGRNVRVEACIGSGKTTAIQALCDLFPKNKMILYLTYNKLLKIDAKSKIKNPNTIVTNYHGFVYPYLVRNGIRCGLSDSIRLFTENRLSIPRFDVLIIDEYQDIELDFSEMLEYVKSTNPDMQIIMVGDMAQKIYDKTTLDVREWSDSFLGDHVELEFTQCFRLQAELAAKLGRIWEKNIVGVNADCTVSTMSKDEVIAFLKMQDPENVLCLGAKTGAMMDVLNILETDMPFKYNKKTVYATIKTSEAHVEPNNHTAIFTTFDSSKGLEKPTCVVFDWDEAYWEVRRNQPEVNSDILRNIFCVAASRGKQQIIFVENRRYGKSVPLLSEETLKEANGSKPLTDTDTATMFDFKYVEDVTNAYNLIDVVKLDTNETTIEINENDELIDLSPCIQEYMKLVFFKNYDILTKLDYAFRQKNRKMPDMSKFSIDEKLLTFVSLITNQNRYYNQVKLPLMTPTQHNKIINRLSERLTPDEDVLIEKSMDLYGIAVHGIADVIRDDTIWQLDYTAQQRPESFLRAAMNAILFNKSYCMLWNIRNNELYKVSVDAKKKDAFLQQVYKTVTKKKNIPSKMHSKHEFVPGERVHHKQFGDGLVVAVRQSLRDHVLDVAFVNANGRSIIKTISEWNVQPI